jgi:hypothetical protein
LGATIAALNDARASSAGLSAQLVDELTALSPEGSQPTRGVLAGFANEFTPALIGKGLTSLQRNALQRAITEMLQPSGTSFRPADALRAVLVAAGVRAQRTQHVVTDFIAIGEDLRGPDDIGIRPVRAK